ncbi:hypothetical protein SSX86_019030 [Deinandra increscens subsp. villosa]|uniref:Molybdenum cofactor sulfurase n=1 Tax=Deinandra increscens subsp. villosa TaxID=3103831 RepID=A0AAP0GU33_9ASTR
MHISLRYACLICHKKTRTKHGSSQTTEEIERNPSEARKSQEIKIKAALQQASEYGYLVKPQNMDVSDAINTGLERSRSLARLEAQKEFLKATSLAADTTFETKDSIPDLDEAFSKFLTMYPKYKSSELIDQLRVTDYAHLDGKDSKVCLDYCGFGLFSYLQAVQYCETCSITLSEITTNLRIHALYGGMNTSPAEHDIKTRIMDYLKIPTNEYGLVFTVSRGSAFKLLAESYPFSTKQNLLTMFDHESQSVNWMAQDAKRKGAKVHSAWFKWPTLKPCSTHLRKQILNRKRSKKDSSKGLFVFPVQSRVTGAKYSYQWMSFAQQNNWHVLLDAGALGPLDMDSLGLSFFRPDFIITSFYRVFRFDPTGFGCLLIKKTAIKDLQKQSTDVRSSGIVKIDSVFPTGSTGRFSQLPGAGDDEDDVIPDTGIQLPAFSGVINPTLVRDHENDGNPNFEKTEMTDAMGQFSQFSGAGDDEDDVIPETHTGVQLPAAFSGVIKPIRLRDYENDGNPNFEETDMFSIMKSPNLTRIESPEESMWIELGHSPLESPSTNHKQFDSYPHESNNFTKTEEHSPEIQEEPEIDGSVIRRETERDFRLRRPAFNLEEEDEYVDLSDEESDTRGTSEIICEHLDHVNMLGLSKTTSRLRFLINWLVTSLLQLKLKLPGGLNSNGEDLVPLVHIYGPKIKYERGASVAFNVRDRITGVVSPEMVQKMAEANGISLGVAILSHVKIIQNRKKQSGGAMEVADTTVCRPMEKEKKEDNVEGFVRAEVVTASLGFLSNFEDVYRLWVFVAKFLNPSFVRDYGLSTVMEDEES